MDRRDLGSWLSGPRAAQPSEAGVGYRGQRLGRPETGPGSVASLPRRFGAVCVDWFMCVLIVRGLFGGHEWAVLGAFALVNVLLISTLGSGFGGRLFGIRVVRLDGGPAYPLAVLVRTLLLCLVVPVFIMDRDGRGLHDQAAGLVVVRI